MGVDRDSRFIGGTKIREGHDIFIIEKRFVFLRTFVTS
jgi:hypothetical protein